MKTTPPKAHQHVYDRDIREGWDGYVCMLCGFRIPAYLLKPAVTAGATVKS